tara:strand:+ start:66 stop:572 length:507 start_codon:yes stop_codon:yes gene_type:complete
MTCGQSRYNNANMSSIEVGKKATPQEYWDMLILDSWNSNGISFGAFKGLREYRGIVIDPDLDWTDIRDKVFEGLDRKIIRHFQQTKKPMRSLVTDHLPQLSAYLWHIWPMHTDEQYHKAMEILTNSVAVGVLKNPPRSELKKTGDALRRERFFSIHKGHRRSDWEKVK